MTTEETIKRNEAIAIMECGAIVRIIKYQRKNYHNDWSLLMPAYEHIQSLGYFGVIEKLAFGDHRVYFTNALGVEVGTGNRDEDLRTAIWLTVSDFAIEFNKKKENG